jgi:hypothetical protein
MAQVSGIEVKFSANTTQLDNAVKQAENSVLRFGKAANSVNTAQLTSRMQSVSWQVQDFATQVGAGTAATVALGQQLPQLLSGFGPLGAAIGTVAAIALPLAGYFFASAKETRNFADVALDAAEKIDVLSKSINALIEKIQDGSLKSSALSAELQKLAEINIGINAAESVDALRNSFMSLGTELQGWSGWFTGFQTSLGNATQTLSGVDRAVLALIPGLTQFRGVISATTEQSREIVGLTASLRNWGVEANDAVKLAIQLSEAFNNTNATEAARQLADVAIKLNDIKTITPEARGQINEFFKYVLALTKGTSELNTELAKSAALMSDMAGIGSYGPSTAESGTTIKEEVKEERPAAIKVPKVPAPRETGIYREEDPFFIDRLDAIREQFKTEREVLAEEYALNQETVRNALNNGLIEKAEFDALELQMAEEHQKKLNAIKMAGIDTQLSATADLFGSLAQLTNSGNKKLMKLSKAFSIAQVVINTAQGISKAFAQFGWPAGIGPAAAIAASGAVQLANIASAESGKIKGGGGGGGRGSAAAEGGSTGSGGGPTTTFQFTLMNDPMGFGEKFARQFIDQLNSTQRNGGTIRGVIA